MPFNFDHPVNRKDTDSYRWDQFKNEDVIPLWVADMDFASPPCVIEAVQARVAHGVFGYTHAPFLLQEKIAQHIEEQYDWKIDPSWIVLLPSVVSGLYTAVRQLTNADQHVLIPKPVYHHLRLACSQSARDYSEIPLHLEKDRWVMPFNDLSAYLKKQSKLALLCNPQNPGSTVFTKNELQQFGDFCHKNDLWICSDEIHAGLVLDQNKKHIPIASLSQEISMRTVTLMSLNKTFNFPGIGLAWAIAENPDLRKKMQADLHATIADPTLLAYTCTMAALESGEPWRQELLSYLRSNRDMIKSSISSIPELDIGEMEASYLAWIDCTKLELKSKQSDPRDLFLKAGVALSPGSQFNAPSFVRLNFGTQTSLLVEALDRIKNAVETL
jgi:cystathionine beta-lyase